MYVLVFPHVLFGLHHSTIRAGKDSSLLPFRRQPGRFPGTLKDLIFLALELICGTLAFQVVCLTGER